MKTNTLFLLLVLFFSNTLSAQNSDGPSFKSAADSKGEVIALYFNWGDKKCRMWRISDGELLYNDKVNAFGYASKMLRFKIQDADWKERDISKKKNRILSQALSFDSHEIKHGSDYFTFFNTNVDYKGSGVHFFDVDNKITLFFETIDRTTTLYNVTHYNSPNFKKVDNYSNMEKIMKRKDLESQYLFHLLISPTGKYVFINSYGVLLSLEKNKELWNITQKEGDRYDYYQVAFSTDESQIAVTSIATAPNSIYIYEVKNGKKLKELSVPETLQNRLNIEKIHPASDMKSYIVEGDVKNEKKAECWLVKADGTTQLLKME